MLGLLGRKLGMTQCFDDEGNVIPVTAIRVGPCLVVQKKTKESDGYHALQLGFEKTIPSRMKKARRGHLEKKGLPLLTTLQEFRTEGIGDFDVGEELTVSGFQPGDVVSVRGVTKGRGFQGVMKRHGKHGGPAAHGSDFHRRPGSIGMRTWPGHVLKNMKLPGHMGHVQVTVKNLQVVSVDPHEEILLLRGAIPGAKNGIVVVTPTNAEFEKRSTLKRVKKEATS